MRLPSLALLGLVLAASPALAGSAKDRAAGQQAKASATAPATGAARQGSRQPRATASAKAAAPHRGGKTASSAGGRTGTVHRSGPVRSHQALPQDRRAAIAVTACKGRGAVRCSSRSVAWTHGLPPAAGVQAVACPAGTMATLAIGHDDVVRCMPL